MLRWVLGLGSRHILQLGFANRANPALDTCLRLKTAPQLRFAYTRPENSTRT